MCVSISRGCVSHLLRNTGGESKTCICSVCLFEKASVLLITAFLSFQLLELDSFHLLAVCVCVQ